MVKAMRVKVRFKDHLAASDHATLFLISTDEVWLPNWAFRYGQGRTLIVDRNIAIQKGVKFSEYVHIPDPIEPVRNQEPIDELRYDTKSGD